jgi:DNA-binding CsgD family transcriptional regulator
MALHRRLADGTADPEERARHLALGTDGPDAEVADALETAARHARARGSREGAAELAELSIDRTPADRADDVRRRRVTAAEYQFHLGYPARARSMVMASHEASSPGPERVPGLLLLATIDYWTGGGSAPAAQWCDQAMREAGSDRVLTARGHAALADLAPYDAEELLGHARTAVELMGEGDDAPPEVLASALKNVAYHELRLGHGLSLPLLERAEVAEARSDPVPIIERVGMCAGMLLRFAGHFADARRALLEMRQSAEDEGDDSALPNILGHLALLECWAGDDRLALQYVSEGRELIARTGVGSPSVTAAHALAEAHRGNLDEARRIAEAALADDESQGEAADVACDLRSIGFTELAAGALAPAAEHFLRAMAIAADLGVNEPAILRIHADAVEALVGLDRLDEAERLTAQLEATAGADATWSRAMGRRGRGLLLAAQGDLDRAADALATALEDHDAIGMPFETARTRLLLGRVLRRMGRRTEARETLEAAAAVFTELGMPRYADEAQAELARLGGRVAAPLMLTATERRVAELVGAGRTNQEAAETLFISVRTVESHLGRIYRKLGVRSRTELAASGMEFRTSS